jgi:uncharacterized membrane protein
MRWLYLSFLAITLVGFAKGASISGNVYDYGLQPVNGAVIAINTVPRQQMVISNLSYRFNVPPGRYNLTASYDDGSLRYVAREGIQVQEEGDYTLDIILMPTVGDEDNLTDLPSYEYEPDMFPGEKRSLWPALMMALGIAAIAGSIVLINVLRNPAMKRDTDREGSDEDILSLIRKQKRITQKDIRKIIPLSEAKISLVIADLESQGRIRKIRKGRGNIIFYKK